MQKKKMKTADLVYIGLSAALIAICAWIALPLAVPVTLQTLGICLVAGLLGAKRGTLATLVYVLLGCIGLPVFTGFKGGIGVLFGATGGYILGFLFTALIVGAVSDKWGEKWWALMISMLLGVLTCYAFGTAWFMLVYSKGAPITLAKTLTLCVTPFLIPDAVKIALATLLTHRLKRFVK